jgi:RNA-directed DNA polymerase
MIVERMAKEMGLPAHYVYSIARTASHEYKQYSIQKRDGGTRTIHHPSRRLKALQRWLLANVIEHLPVHVGATAYRKGQSIFDNASVHATSRYLLRMDFTNFFPSITETDVNTYIAGHESLFVDWTPEDINTVCKLVCRNSVLTIGAPTSPSLSNVLCYDLDVDLHGLCEKYGVSYTRYADDLFFSTTNGKVLRQLEKQVPGVISKLKLPADLKINKAKTRHSSKRGARRVTGIVLGSDGSPHIGRRLKRKIRAMIHKYDTFNAKEQSSLAGLIAYAIGFDPNFINMLINKYGLPKIKAAMAPIQH